MSNVLLHQIKANFISTIIAIAVLAFIYVVVTLVFTYSMESKRRRHQFRARTFYILIILLLFFMAKIWVDGFSHLLAILGLVSAALVITNKEIMLSFSGWLIIIWRGLFAEDDLIAIQQYRGYVKNIGILYFTLAEVGEGSNKLLTGKIIRIPNNFITLNALVNYSQLSHLLEQRISITLTKNSDVLRARELLKSVVDEILVDTYKDHKAYNPDYISKQNRKIVDTIHLGVKVFIKVLAGENTGYELTAKYYCFASDYETIEQRIWVQLLTAIKAVPEVELA